MDELDKKIKVEKFVEDLEHDLYELKRFKKFLDFDTAFSKEFEKEMSEAISILEKKIKDIKKSRSLKEVSGHIKLKKLYKRYNYNGEVYKD